MEEEDRREADCLSSLGVSDPPVSQRRNEGRKDRPTERGRREWGAHRSRTANHQVTKRKIVNQFSVKTGKVNEKRLK